MKFKRVLAIVLAAAFLSVGAGRVAPVRAEGEAPAAAESKSEPKAETKSESKTEVKSETKTETKAETSKEEPKPEAPKEEPKPETPKEEPKPEIPKEEPKPEASEPADGSGASSGSGDAGTEPAAGETSAPVETQTPAPVETSIPEETSTPGPAETSTPDETAVPGESAAPDETAVPGESAAPDETAVPGETPVPEETAEPEETSEPEQTPEPVKITALSASRSVIAVGKTVTFSFSAENADAFKYTLTDPSGGASSGTLSGSASAYSLKPEREGNYVFALTAVGGDGSEDSARASVEAVVVPELKVSAKTDVRSIFGGDAVSFAISRSGSTELETCAIKVTQGSGVIYTSDAFEESVEAKTKENGKVASVTLTVDLTDVYGQSAHASVSIPCAVHASETRAQWERTMKDVKLTGVWPEDLVAIALSQVGYHESLIDFEVDEDGERQGYTRYGDWYGMPYVDWCAMYVCFCLHYAGIPTESFAHSANNQRWIRALKKQGLYASRTDYNPMVGDLAFFDWQNNNDADHVGIITKVVTNDEGRVTSFTTVEGNNKQAVYHGDTYSTGDVNVVGYGLVNKAYDRRIEAQHRELTAEGEDYTVTASFDPDAKIPARAAFEVREIARDSERYGALVARAEQWAGEEGESALNFARFFELGFTGVDGESVVPQAPVNYTITYSDKVRTGKSLVPGVVEADAKGVLSGNDSLSFSSGKSGSAFAFALEPREAGAAVAGTIVSGRLTYKPGKFKSDESNYSLTVSYDADARVPEGATLSITRLMPGTAGYGRCLRAVHDIVGKDGGKQLLAYDIGVELNGMKVDPKQDVEVELSLEQAGDGVRVVRVVDGSELAAELTRKDGRAVVRFSTDRFSEFCLIFEGAEAADD